MMELIKITKNIIGDEEIDSVNGRDLWEALELKKQYGDWIKSNLEYYSEGIDFKRFHLKVKREDGVYINKKEYILTLDTAKHLAMVSRTEKGKQVRNYFIEVEKRSRVLTLSSKYENNPLMQQMRQTMMLYESQLELEHNQKLLATEQSAQADKIKVIEAKQAGIDSSGDFFSIMGYCSLHKIKIDVTLACKFGKHAKRISNSLGYMIGRVKDARYGQVNTYHVEVLDGVASKYAKGDSK